MPKSPRKRIPPKSELLVLDRSRRRCALCFLRAGDLDEKRGQIAHLNGDRADPATDNLAYLCLNHHSQFDSRTSQHKNYTIDEVKHARELLVLALHRGEHMPAIATAVSRPLGEADRITFQKLQDLLPEQNGVSPLRGQAFWSRFLWTADAMLLAYLGSTSGATHHFLDAQLEALRARLYEVAAELLDSVHRYSDALPGSNTDRFFWKLDGESVAELDARRMKVRSLAEQFCGLYDELVLTARRKLAALGNT